MSMDEDLEPLDAGGTTYVEERDLDDNEREQRNAELLKPLYPAIKPIEMVRSLCRVNAFRPRRCRCRCRLVGAAFARVDI